MKRKLALLLACVLVLALFSGCGGKKPAGDATPDTGTEPSPGRKPRS